MYFWATTPVLISVLTFATYVLMGKQLTAAKVGEAHCCNDGCGSLLQRVLDRVVT